MAPTADLPIHPHPSSTNGRHQPVAYPPPLVPSGSLDRFEFEETTPVIGREYPHVNIVDDLLNASNSDELVRDLAIAGKYLTISMADVLYILWLTCRYSLPARCSVFPGSG